MREAISGQIIEFRRKNPLNPNDICPISGIN